jgi:hypothetical protein
VSFSPSFVAYSDYSFCRGRLLLSGGGSRRVASPDDWHAQWELIAEAGTLLD